MNLRETPSGSFAFGRNWQSFLRRYTPGKQKASREALLSFLKLENLKDKTFLDIGCGSGIHSAAAWLAGAAHVHSFDYDPDSVAATRQLHRYHGSPKNWTIEQRSALDEDYLRRLGTFDIVYSWGVLHHTGDQWRALKNTLLNMHDRSRLYIALYAKEAYPDWKYWLSVKERYNRAGRLQKRLLEARFLWETHLSKNLWNIFGLPEIIRRYHARGMDLMTDMRDWLGGWPTEFSSIHEVADFMKAHGLALVNLVSGEGNSEFLFMCDTYAAEQGYAPMDIHAPPYDFPLVDISNLPSQPVWIFGTGRGGDLMCNYLSKRGVPVAGFIDVAPQAKPMRGLPVLHVEGFIREASKASPVILANRFFKENGLRLYKAGFSHLLNGHQLVTMLHRHGADNPRV